MAFVNHFYFYLWDSEWGAAFWKTNTYAPFPIWIWLNGHEWAKRQLEKASIAYIALDNGFRSCTDPATLQKIWTGWARRRIGAFFSAGFDTCPRPSRLTMCAPVTSTRFRYLSHKSLVHGRCASPTVGISR
jgi:hypothetical protein